MSYCVYGKIGAHLLTALPKSSLCSPCRLVSWLVLICFIGLCSMTPWHIRPPPVRFSGGKTRVFKICKNHLQAANRRQLFHMLGIKAMVCLTTVFWKTYLMSFINLNRSSTYCWWCFNPHISIDILGFETPGFDWIFKLSLYLSRHARASHWRTQTTNSICTQIIPKHPRIKCS